MTVSICLTSIEPAGKTALAAAIGKNLQGIGKRVGYFIPIEPAEGKSIYQDATFIKQTLGLQEDLSQIAPLRVTTQELWKMLTEDEQGFNKKVKNNFNRVAQDKDVVIIEGLDGMIRDAETTLACYRISETLNSPVLVVVRYSDQLDPALLERIKQELGKRFAGVIINFIPGNKLENIKKEVLDRFHVAGIKVLGVIQEDRTLLGVSVNELAAGIGGNIVTAKDNADQIVENIMLGALTIDSGISYFSRKSNKAAIIRSERPDIQLAALETPAACLVLTGKAEPLPTVVYNAENKRIPIITVPKETNDVIKAIENVLNNSLFNSQLKLQRFQQMLKSLDFKALYSVIGLTG